MDGPLSYFWPRVNSLEESQIVIKAVFRVFMFVGIIFLGVGIAQYYGHKTRWAYPNITWGIIFIAFTILYYSTKTVVAAFSLLLVSAAKIVSFVKFEGIIDGTFMFFLLIFFFGSVNGIRALIAYKNFKLNIANH